MHHTKGRVEPILFVLTLYGFFFLALGRTAWVHVRDERRERRLRQYCRELPGQRVQVALELFGEPFSVFTGQGRTLMEWKSPPADTFPPGSGLTIFYLVVDANKWIVQASWQTREEGRWRSGREPRIG